MKSTMASGLDQRKGYDPFHTIHPSPRATLGALAFALALTLLQLAGASDFVTDILSISILTGTLAFARVLDRRMGVAGALIAGGAAAIVPGGTPAFPPSSAWEVLPRFAAFAMMATMYYLVVVALRTREERLQRQFADLGVLHEEVRALHVLAASSPIDRHAVYRQIVEAVAYLTNSPRSQLALINDQRDAPAVVATWPPSHCDDERRGMAGSASVSPLAAPTLVGGHVRIPLTGDAGTIGFIEIERTPHSGADWDRADLVAVFARDAGLALEHIALRDRLERLLLTEERARIARELHDGLVQTLGAIAYRMEFYAGTLAPETTESVLQGLETASADVRDALRRTRLMIYGLRDVTRSGDFSSRLRVMLDSVANEAGIAVSADLSEDVPALPAESAETILAVAQEALQNVIKHAEAESVSLALLVTQGCIELTIADDGRGFVHPTDGAEVWPLQYGLLGIRERAAQQGGTVTIQTAPEMGTCVTLSLPIEGAA